MMESATVMGGMDAFSARIADAFGSTPPEGHAPLIVHLVGDDGLKTFKNRLSEQDCSRAPGVILLVSAFDSAGEEHLSQLSPLSDMLRVLYPGGQSIQLVVLLPPATADDAAKISTYRFFLKLEAMACRIPFLTAVFVVPLSPSIHAHPEGAPGATHPLSVLFNRQLYNSDLQNIFGSIGTAALANRTTAAGRNACYLFSGAYRLDYYQSECLAYLEKRSQQEIVEKGLLDRQAVLGDRESCRSLENECAALISHQIQKQRQQVNDFSAKHDQCLSRSTSSEEGDSWTGRLEQQFGEIISNLKTEAQKELNALRLDLKQHLQDYLRRNCGTFAKSIIYMEALCGYKLSPQEEAGQRPPGLYEFQTAFYQAPLLSAIESLFSPICRQFAIGVPASDDGNPEGAWLFRMLASDGETKRPSNERHPLTALVKACLKIFAEHATIGQIRLQDVQALAQSISRKIEIHDQEIERQLREIDETRQNLKAIHDEQMKNSGFWARNITRRSEHKAEEKQFHAEFQKADDSEKALRQSSLGFQNTVRALFESVLIPSALAALFNQTLAEELTDACQQMQAFNEALLSKAKAQFAAASLYTTKTTPIGETVLNAAILERLYADGLGKLTMAEHGLKALAFLPQQLSDAEKKRLTYYHCRDLADHFKAGHAVVLARVLDYARERFGSVRKMTISDIIGLMGSDAIPQTVRRCLSRMEQSMELSPGLLPLAHQGSRQLAVHTDSTVNRTLKERLDASIVLETQDFDTGNPHRIDFTLLYLGLPAFVIHRLKECRELFQKAQAEDNRDLWPVQAQPDLVKERSA